MKFNASVTFIEITPAESAELGGFSNSGFVHESIDFENLRELIDYMERNGLNIKRSEYPNFSDHTWFSTQYFTTDYKTGTERQESIHIKTSAKNKERIWNLLKP